MRKGSNRKTNKKDIVTGKWVINNKYPNDRFYLPQTFTFDGKKSDIQVDLIYGEYPDNDTWYGLRDYSQDTYIDPGEPLYFKFTYGLNQLPNYDFNTIGTY